MEKIDTGTDHLIFEKSNGVALLTMNRPEARNAMSGEMNQAMQEVLAEVEFITMSGLKFNFSVKDLT